MYQKRDILLSIILTFVTCGIYGLVWWAKINDEINNEVGDYNAPSGIVVILLSIVTCNIYGCIWAYKMGEKVAIIKNRNGVNDDSSSVLFLILQLFGCSIVNIALMQDALNNYADRNGGYNTYNQQNQNPYGQNQYNQNPYGQNQYNQNPYGQNQYNQNPYGQNQYNQNPYGQNQYNPYAQNNMSQVQNNSANAVDGQTEFVQEPQNPYNQF